LGPSVRATHRVIERESKSERERATDRVIKRGQGLWVLVRELGIES